METTTSDSTPEAGEVRDSGGGSDICLFCNDGGHERAACPRIANRRFETRRQFYLDEVELASGSTVVENAFFGARNLLLRIGLLTQDTQRALEATSAAVFFAELTLLAHAVHKEDPGPSVDGQRLHDLVRDCERMGFVIVNYSGCNRIGSDADELYECLKAKQGRLWKRIEAGDYFDSGLGMIKNKYEVWEEPVTEVGVVAALSRARGDWGGSTIPLRDFVQALRDEFDRSTRYMF